MLNQVMRIVLKSYDHELIDASLKKVIKLAEKTGAKISGPIPLPTKKEVITILRAVHKYKDSREQFEQRTHKRILDILITSQQTIEELKHFEMPKSVSINIIIKDKNKKKDIKNIGKELKKDIKDVKNINKKVSIKKAKNKTTDKK